VAARLTVPSRNLRSDLSAVDHHAWGVAERNASVFNLLEEFSTVPNSCGRVLGPYFVGYKCHRHVVSVTADFGVALAPLIELAFHSLLELLIGALVGQARGCQ
jgi:hypothetical protein